MSYLIGVDIGTSGTKTVMFDERGNTVASATEEYPLYQERIGWAEQDPLDWWNATKKTLAAVMAKSGVNKADVKGIGLSGQMHGLVMLDKSGTPLRKSIIWCDQRTAAECAVITEKVGAERLISITANPALTGFTASKILWVKRNEPDIYEKTHKILLPKDYIRYMLTGEYATEVSDASGMQLMNIKERNWSNEILDILEIDINLLGKMYESCEVTGKVTKSVADATGLAEGTIVVGGGGDQAAGAVGNGIVREGIVSSTIGTSGVVFAHTDSISIDPKGRVHTFCHAVPGCWHIMGVTQGAGLSLQWFRNQFCGVEMQTADAMGVDPYMLMDKEAERIPAACDGLVFLPYMMGERTPHLDPDAKGVFYGLSNRHGKSHMLRAVMEGVSYSLLDCLNIIRGMGINPSEIRASGGGGKSGIWKQMQADMFNCNVTTVNSKEGPALGVAILAAVGAGIYASVPEACSTVIATGSPLNPVAADAAAYAKQYEIYTGLYTALAPFYKKTAALVN